MTNSTASNVNVPKCTQLASHAFQALDRLRVQLETMRSTGVVPDAEWLRQIAFAVQNAGYSVDSLRRELAK